MLLMHRLLCSGGGVVLFYIFTENICLSKVFCLPLQHNTLGIDVSFLLTSSIPPFSGSSLIKTNDNKEWEAGRRETFCSFFCTVFCYYLEKLESNLYFLKSASNLNGNLNCSKELEHYSS